jgi:hypothetical protein
MELGKRLFITTAAIVVLVLVMVISACSQGGTSTTITKTVAATGTAEQAVYKVLNPQGIPAPVDCKALSPRLDSLAGKKILFYQSEATNMQLPVLLDKLKAAYPTATFDTVYTASFGDRVPTDEQKQHQACIRGVSW